MESSVPHASCAGFASSSSSCGEEHVAAAASPLSTKVVTIANNASSIRCHPKKKLFRRQDGKTTTTRYRYLSCYQFMVNIICTATIFIHCICISDAMLMPSHQIRYNPIPKTSAKIHSKEQLNLQRGGANRYRGLTSSTALLGSSESSQEVSAQSTTSSWRKRQRRKIIAPLKQLVGRIRSKSPLREKFDDTLAKTSPVNGVSAANSMGSSRRNNFLPHPFHTSSTTTTADACSSTASPASTAAAANTIIPVAPRQTQ
mmetsp:Transcript_12535/g.18757  ORF Transcript_12535/g.18757 Transcript_12535/m.18757 type:complete len:258 (-) Transcript_12535:1437-2210(-)